MLNERQPVDKLIFQEGSVWAEVKGVQKPLDNIVDYNSSNPIINPRTFEKAAADYAELDGR